MDNLNYKVLNSSGKEVGQLELDRDIFAAPINESLVHDVVVWQLAKRRRGTHSTLTKGVMEGSRKKPWKQKGSGKARAGTAQSPLWVGGAVAHGPHPRDYTTRLSKRTRRQALTSVLTQKVRDSRLVILDDFGVKQGKTKEIAKTLSNVAAGARGVVIVAPKEAVLAERASRNLNKVLTLGVAGVNVYDLLRHDYLICTKESVSALVSRLKQEAAPSSKSGATKKSAKTKSAAKES